MTAPDHPLPLSSRLSAEEFGYREPFRKTGPDPVAQQDIEEQARASIADLVREAGLGRGGE